MIEVITSYKMSDSIFINKEAGIKMLEVIISYKTSDDCIFTNKDEAVRHEDSLINKGGEKRFTKFLSKMFNLKEPKGVFYKEMVDAEREFISSFESNLVNLAFVPIGVECGIKELSEDILAIYQFFGPEKWLQIHNFLAPKKQSNKGSKK